MLWFIAKRRTVSFLCLWRVEAWRAQGGKSKRARVGSETSWKKSKSGGIAEKKVNKKEMRGSTELEE